MSSFMCSAETISDLADYIYKIAMWDEAKLHLALKEANGDNEITEETVFAILFQMNLDALVSRYGLATAEEMYDKDTMFYIPKMFREEKTAPVIFKEFECFLYQCMEKGVQGTKLFDVLCDINMNMAYEVARMSEEYQNAAWG